MNRLAYGQRSGFSIFWLIGGFISLAAAFWLLSQPESTQALTKLILPSVTSTSKGSGSNNSNNCQGTNCRNPIFADTVLQPSAPPAPAVQSQNSERSAPKPVSIPAIKGASSGTTILKDVAQPSQKPEAGSPAYYHESGHDGGGATSGSHDTTEHSVSGGGSPATSGDHGGTSDDGGDHH